MNRQDFFEWLDTIIDKGNSDWEIVEDFADGNIWVRFTNIEEDEDKEHTQCNTSWVCSCSI